MGWPWCSSCRFGIRSNRLPRWRLDSSLDRLHLLAEGAELLLLVGQGRRQEVLR
jgi:hypothetical protein